MRRDEEEKEVRGKSLMNSPLNMSLSNGLTPLVAVKKGVHDTREVMFMGVI